MLINETYDKSIWLMLCSDRVNREKIVDFFNSVPTEFYNKLRISLGFYVSKEMNFSINKQDRFYKSFLSGEMKTPGDMRYWYMIEPNTGALSLGENVIDEEEGFEYSLFHMILYPIDERILKDESKYVDCLIGKVTDDYCLDGVNNMSSFHLIRFPLCDLIVSSSNKSSYNKNKYRLVDMDRMPEKYSLCNLKSKDSIKKLIRGKNSR